ncbi:MAG: hypothetical protein WA964_20515 [Ilumatobacter sp.]|uniref:hypothetical protein n=1 Tax=Ilumatobacter sp. TaxID=1967498 RepID=UPI003C735755
MDITTPRQLHRRPLVVRTGRHAAICALALAVVTGCSGSDDLPPPPEERTPAEGTANDAVATFPEPESDLDLPVSTDG